MYAYYKLVPRESEFMEVLKSKSPFQIVISSSCMYGNNELQRPGWTWVHGTTGNKSF